MKHVIHICNEQLPLTIVRRKGQKNLRIRLKNDAVLVSGPTSVSKKMLLSFVDEQKHWIVENRQRQLNRLKELRELNLKNQGTIRLYGRHFRLKPDPDRTAKKTSLRESNGIIIYRFNPEDIRHASGQPEQDTILSFYRSRAKKELPDWVHKWSRITAYKPARVSIRNQKTKWGSCSARGTISLNWRLIMCPPDIIDYIVVHELCHLHHFNHSPSFWRTVSEWHPNVESAKKWIRTHSDELFQL